METRKRKKDGGGEKGREERKKRKMENFIPKKFIIIPRFLSRYYHFSHIDMYYFPVFLKTFTKYICG